MPSVKVKENEPFDVALRRFKRSCEKAGVLSEVRRREFYEKAHGRSQAQGCSCCEAPPQEAAARSPSFRKVLLNSRPQADSHGRFEVTDQRRNQDRNEGAPTKSAWAALRMINAEIKRIEVDERKELDDDDVLEVLTRMLKQRRDSLSQFEEAGREDPGSYRTF